MDISRIDQIIQYALLLAGEEDDARDRQLGPIHLLKYVYLADLAFAKANRGKTYTDVPWKFHNFGPWALPVVDRIEPALLAIGAQKQVYPSDYPDRDEWVRWNKRDSARLSRLGDTLPVVITASVRKMVRDFGSATSDLLTYVYSTSPMRQAAPNETLDFAPRVQESLGKTTLPTLTAKQKKKLKESMNGLRAKAAARREDLKNKPPALPPDELPRYDGVFFKGMEWLDSLAGEPVPAEEMTAVFSDDIWKSPARTDDELP